jgi:hypothetical protein
VVSDLVCAVLKVFGLQQLKLFPVTGLLQSVAIGEMAEETKPSEPSRQMCRFRRCSEPTGRNASERRAGLETTNVSADLALTPIARKSEADVHAAPAVFPALPANPW